MVMPDFLRSVQMCRGLWVEFKKKTGKGMQGMIQTEAMDCHFRGPHLIYFPKLKNLEV